MGTGYGFVVSLMMRDRANQIKTSTPEPQKVEPPKVELPPPPKTPEAPISNPLVKSFVGMFAWKKPPKKPNIDYRDPSLFRNMRDDMEKSLKERGIDFESLPEKQQEKLIDQLNRATDRAYQTTDETAKKVVHELETTEVGDPTTAYNWAASLNKGRTWQNTIEHTFLKRSTDPLFSLHGAKTDLQKISGVLPNPQSHSIAVDNAIKIVMARHKTDKQREKVESSQPRLINGGDQAALEKSSREHFASLSGRTVGDVPEDELFGGSVAEQKERSVEFAKQFPPKIDGDLSRYNLWSGRGREEAEKYEGFVMQQTEEFASAIWELRNVAGFKDSATKWPWDPDYHLKMAKWLEGETAKTGEWPSQDAIAAKLQELHKTHVPLPQHKIVIEHDGGELIGFNRKIGDSIFEPPSFVLAKKVADALIPVGAGFGLDTHSQPDMTVQAQVEIPTYSARIAKNADKVKGLSDDVRLASLGASDEKSKLKLDAAADKYEEASRQMIKGSKLIGSLKIVDQKVIDFPGYRQRAEEGAQAIALARKLFLEGAKLADEALPKYQPKTVNNKGDE